MRSTSGTYTAYVGPRTHCSLSAQSKKHDATSHHTAEAEIVALDLVVRRDGLPLLQLNDKLFGPMEMFVEEDNQPAIIIVNKAKLSTVRHLNRTHKVNDFSLHEVFDRETQMHLRKVHTNDQAADIFTKTFSK